MWFKMERVIEMCYEIDNCVQLCPSSLRTDGDMVNMHTPT